MSKNKELLKMRNELLTDLMNACLVWRGEQKSFNDVKHAELGISVLVQIRVHKKSDTCVDDDEHSVFYENFVRTQLRYNDDRIHDGNQNNLIFHVLKAGFSCV